MSSTIQSLQAHSMVLIFSDKTFTQLPANSSLSVTKAIKSINYQGRSYTTNAGWFFSAGTHLQVFYNYQDRTMHIRDVQGPSGYDMVFAQEQLLTFKAPGSDESTLTQALQLSAAVTSFANKIIQDNSAIDKTVKEMALEGNLKRNFAYYSGLNEPNDYLGSFFKIARYVDQQSKKQHYQDLHYPAGSPLAPPKPTYDMKPWDLYWQQLPVYLTAAIATNWNAAMQRYTGKHVTRQRPSEEVMEAFYDGLQTSDKLNFLKDVSIVSCARNPIIQAQNNNAPFIQGYIMNVLNLNGQAGQQAYDYYHTALSNRMGLLSGPSGTAHRINNLLREMYADYDSNPAYAYKAVALCLAALGVPYNNHSYYEIATVIFGSAYPSLNQFKLELIRLGFKGLN
ncbi:hypothetical protein BKI52_10900 [marine bacterium AO1-C]|nr:hypothetical protein BKI52_10900 [marine bacterium AO1-C]